jgi:hypothetical protein
MELFLNILWVLIVLGALGVWCINWACHKRRTSTKLLQEWIALICALVFLFFAVSLSDDLHTAATLCDDAAAGRRQSLVWDCAHSSHQNAERPQVPSAAAPSRLLFSVNLQVAERILPAATHVASGLKERSLFGRSPPRSVNS